MAAAPTFVRHAVDTMVCSEGGVTSFDLRGLLSFNDVDGTDTFSVFTGPTPLGTISGGPGSLTLFPGTMSSGAGVLTPAPGSFLYSFSANSFGIRSFTIKISDGTGWDTVQVNVHLVRTPSVAVAGTYNSVHVGSSISLSGVAAPDFTRSGPTSGYTTTWTSLSPSIASVTSSGVVGGASVGTATISFAGYSATCGIANANSTTTNITVLTNIPPTVSAVSGTALYPGQTINLTGTFSGAASGYIVYFGSVRGTVNSVSATSMSVTVPAGAAHAPIHILDSVSQLSAYVMPNFVPTHNTNGFIGSTDMDVYSQVPNVFQPSTGSSGKPYSVEFADLDGDGKNDMLVCGSGHNKVIVFRNISAYGQVSAASYATPDSFTVAAGPLSVKVGDLDGDGKLDIVTANVGAAGITILRNTSTPGNISFDTRQDVRTPGILPDELTVADFNNDGRPDIAVVSLGVRAEGMADLPPGYVLTTADKTGKLVIVKNNFNRGPSITMTAASFDTVTAYSFDTTSSPISLAAGDFNNDGKIDIVVSDQSQRELKVFRNNTSGGSVAFTLQAHLSTAYNVGSTGLAPCPQCTPVRPYDYALYNTGFPEQVRVGDFDGDGKADIVAAVSDSDLFSNNNYNVISLFRNNTTGATLTFGSSVTLNTNGVSPVGITVSDITGDGKPEVLVSNSGDGRLSIFKNTAISGSLTTSSFSSALTLSTAPGTVCVSVGDIDNNTIKEIAVVNRSTNRVYVFRGYPRPDTTAIIGDSVMCLGGTTTLHSHTMTPASSATTGTWSVISDGTANISIVGTTTDTVVSIHADAAGTDTLMYTVTAFGDTNRVKYAVRVSSIASAGTITIIGGGDSVCVGGSKTLTSTNPGGTWSITSPGGAITITPAGIANGVSAGSGVVQYEVSGCATSSTFNIHTGAQANAGGTLNPTSTTICPTQTSRLRLAPLASRGGVWAIRGSAVTAGTAYGTTDSFEVVGSVAGTSTVVYTYTNDCGVDSATQVITVNTSASAGTINFTNDSVCVTGNVVLSNPTASAGTWSVTGPASLSATTGSTVTLSGTGFVDGIAVVTYSVTSACGSPSTTQNIHVSPNPAHVSISGNVRVCAGSTTPLTVPTLPAGVGATWSVATSSVSTVTSSGVVSGVATGTNTISYTQSNICATLVDTYPDTVSVTPVADVVNGPSTNLCVGSTMALTASSTLGIYDSRVWNTSAPGIATVTSTGVVGGASAGSANISTTINGCTSVTSAPYGVTVDNPVSVGTITGATHLCSGGNTGLTYTGAGGSAASWSFTSGLTPSGVTATSATITAAAIASGFRVDTVTYTATSACGSVPVQHYDTTFANPTAGVINGPATSPLVDSVCVGANYAVSVVGSSTVSITSSAWTSVAPGTASIAGSGTTATVTGVNAGTTTIQYTVNSAYCGSATATRSVNVKGLVSAGSISGPTLICYGATNVMTRTGGNAGGIWKVSDGSGISKVSINAASGNVSGTYVVGPGANPRTSVTIMYVVSGFCNADSTTTLQRSDAMPVASQITTTVPAGSTGLDSICVGANLTQAATPNSTTFPTAGLTTTWSVVTGNLTTSSATPSNVVITGAAAGSDTIIFRIANTCGFDIKKRPIKILPPALESHILAPSIMCLGAVDTFYGQLSDGTIVPGTWSYLNFGSGTPGDNVFVGTFTGYASAGLAGTDRIMFTPVAGSCGSDTSTWDITVVLNPDAGVITGDTSLCVGSILTLTNTPGTGDYWYSSDTSIAKIDSATGVVTGIASGAATIYYVDTNGCGTAADDQGITVRALAEVGFIYGQDTSCVGGSFQVYDTVSAAAGGIWSAAGAVTINSTGVVTAVTPGLGVVTYTSNNDCGVNDTTFDIRVYGNPNMSSQTTLNLCDSANLLYTATSDTATTTFAWTRATVTGLTNPAATGTNTIDEYLDNDNLAVPVTATYVFTLTAHGCVSNQNVAVSVSPTPHITSQLFDTVCSGAPFVYLLTTNTAAASTTSNWTRAAVAGVTPTAGSGSGNINETLSNAPSTSSSTVVYVYQLGWTGCPTHPENVTLQIQPAPAAPQITTHSPAEVCTRTLDQNFGAATVPPAGVTYTWTANGAQVWATGNTRQYSLVNFNEPGNATVYLLASISGYQCASKDSFNVTVGSGLSDLPEVIYFNGDFVCLSNDQDTYQWGWDDRGTLDSAMFNGETNQNYRETNPDFTNKYYWVMTTHNGCMQKSYFNPPTGIKNVGVSLGEMKLYPNPAERFVNVEINNTSGGKYNVEVVNLLGQKLDMKDLINNKTTIDVSDLANGVYFVNCYRDGVKFASAKFVKN